MSADRRPLLGALVVLFAAACFGTLGPVSRLAYEAGIAPVAFVTWRAAVGAIAIASILAWRVRRGRPLVSISGTSRRVRVSTAAAALAATVLNLAIFLAFDRVAVALALLGFYTFPVMVTLANAVLHREPVEPAKLVALGIAGAGLVLVLAAQLDPAVTARFDALGFALALLAAASQTVYILSARVAFERLPAEQLTLIVLVVGAFAYLLITAGSGSLDAVALPFSNAALWPLLLFAGLLGAAVPTLLFLVGIDWIGGTRTAILAMFEPVVGVVLAALVLGEALQPVQLLGGALILTAGVVLQRSAPLASRAVAARRTTTGGLSDAAGYTPGADPRADTGAAD